MDTNEVTVKTLFNANFEDGLNIEDDGFLKLQQKQHDKTAKFFKNGVPSLYFIV